MDPNWLWAAWILAFAVLEAWGIRSYNRGGRMKPLTYWVRRKLGLGQPRSYLSVGWIAVSAAIVWLFIHFALEGTFL